MIKINITLNGESIHVRELHTYFDDGDTINIPVDTFINVVKQNPIGHIDAGDLRELCNGNERQYSLFTEDKGRMVAIYAAPVRTKDLTDDEIREALYGKDTPPGLMNGIRAVIAADREKNK